MSTSFSSKGNQQQTNGKGKRGECDRYSERTVSLNAASDKKSDRRSAETRKRRGKGEGACAAFRRILLRKPQSIDCKVRAAQTEKKQANEKPRKRGWSEIEDF